MQYFTLGYQIHPSRRLRPSVESLRRLVVRAGRLYEQGDDIRRLWQYVTRVDPLAVGRAGWTGLPGRRRQTLYGLRPQTIADHRHPITAGVRDRRSTTGFLTRLDRDL